MDPAKTTRAGSPKRQQGARRIVARLAEAALAVDLVILMATAIVEEVAHEWFGMALFALAIGHVCLRWPIVRATFLGKASVRKFVTLALYLLILACLVALFASSLILSKFAFGWLPALPGASWARGLHMVASYWLFVLAFVHIGMSMRILRRRSIARQASPSGSSPVWLLPSSACGRSSTWICGNTCQWGCSSPLRMQARLCGQHAPSSQSWGWGSPQSATLPERRQLAFMPGNEGDGMIKCALETLAIDGEKMSVSLKRQQIISCKRKEDHYARQFHVS